MKTNQLPHSAAPHTEPCRADSEKRLIAAAKNGHGEALEELLVRHRAALYRAARRFRLSHEDSEDVVQDAFLRALKNFSSFRQESKFSTWLMAILNNSALTLKRKCKIARWCSLDHGGDDFEGASSWDIADQRIGPEQQVLRRELLVVLHAVVLKQSRTHQVILDKCLFERQPIGDVAPSLGLTLSSAKSSLFRAKRRVATSLVRRGFVNQRRDRNKLRTEASGKGT